MIIKRLELENIRSYDKEEIDFPLGIVLLSGDIGAGKSTILLAIEFVLFGIIRGEITGTTLLRHGATNGSVSLTLEIEGKEIEIKRMLKRTSTSISQDVGFLIINDKVEQLSATELKQRVLSLLNYPREMITKKSLIYRYTVYTPQEEMKAILLGDKESRIDTLRKVFNIDKYKRVKNNITIVLQEIKSKRREFASLIHDLEDEKVKHKERQESLQELKEDFSKINLSEIKGVVLSHKQKLEQAEKNIEALNKLEIDLQLREEKLKNVERIFISNKNTVRQLIEKKQESKEPKKDPSILKEEKWKYENTIKEFESKLEESIKYISNLRANKKLAASLKERMVSLSKCPTCLQTVTENHREHIIKEQMDNIRKVNQELEKHLYSEEDIKRLLKGAKEKLELLKSEIVKLEFEKEKEEALLKKQEQINEIEEEQSQLSKEIEEIREDITHTIQTIKTFSDISSEYESLKQELDKLMEREKEREIVYNTKQKEIEYVSRSVEELSESIQKKEVVKLKLDTYTKTQEWIEKKFLQIITHMEQSVLINAHSLFNSMFTTWFRMLIDDEGFEAKIDNEFTPTVTYRGYDIEYTALSGGEKTAAALAYRLALNQVINNIISTIRTKDLIMLDEPTDGFSSEQLDKMREVFSLLNVKQIIIVSHETKVESFVDNVIRINKGDGISKLI